MPGLGLGSLYPGPVNMSQAQAQCDSADQRMAVVEPGALGEDAPILAQLCRIAKVGPC